MDPSSMDHLMPIVVESVWEMYLIGPKWIECRHHTPGDEVS
jgi:hypothetical protein